MIKKWSYVAAAMLTATSGLVLTGCIDNDEPYGIEQIRVATANLLEAKKAAVNAAQAAQDAQLEIEKIKAETEKLRIENEKILAEAQAKVLEAEAKAKELEAQAKAAIDAAEAARLQAEAARYQAEADRVKAETEAYLADKKAALDEFIAQAEIRVKKAQQEYDEAVYKFQQQQIKDADQASNQLYQAWSWAFQAYLDQLAEVNNLNKQYLETQKNYSEAAIDLTKYGESPKYDTLKEYEKAVAVIENSIQQKQEEIAKYNEFISDLQGVQASDLYQLYQKYNAAREANLQELADAEVELAALAIENKDLYDSRKTLYEECMAYRTDHVVEIPAYTWEPDAALAPLGLTNPETVVEPGTSFTLDDPNNYHNAWSDYYYLIDRLTSYLLDENDVAWTQARINEMTRALENADNAYATAKANWENAKKAYNMGNTPDFSVIPMESEMNAAIAAYEAEATKFAGLRQDYVNARTAKEAAQQKVNTEWETLQGNPASMANKRIAIEETLNNTIESATATRDAAFEAADNTCTKKINDADNAQRVAWDKYYEAYGAYQNGVLTGVSGEALQRLEDASNAAYTAAEAQDVKTAEARTKAYDERTAARTIASNNYQKTVRAAWTTHDKEVAEWELAGGYDLSKDPAAAKWYAAQEELTKADEAYQAAWEKINTLAWPWVANENASNVDNAVMKVVDVARKQSAAVGGWNIWAIENLPGEVSDFLIADPEVQEFPRVSAPSHLEDYKAIYTNVRQYVINMSRVAYGVLGWDYDFQTGEWDVDQAFLVDNVTVDMVNAYIAEFGQVNYPDFYRYYFGAFGKTLYLQNRIEVAKAMISNQGLLSDAINPIQENLKALEDLMAEARQGEEDLWAEYNEVDAQIKALEASVNAKIEDLNHWNRQYTYALSKITEAIGMVENEAYYGNITEIIEGLINGYNDDIAICNKRIEELNEQLDRAKYQLDQYVNNEGTLNANPYEIALEYAEATLNAAKEKLEFLKNRADELQAKYEAANK